MDAVLRWLLVLTMVLGTGAGALPAAAQAGARIWLNNPSDQLRSGERLDVRFSVPVDSYVAVLHIDADGTLDFLYPSTPWRSEYVRGGWTNSLPALGAASRHVRSARGIGYVYLIASPYPLDFSYFRGPVGTAWYWGGAGRTVRGDPFLAFEQITRLVVPSWPSAMYASDYYGYYVGGFQSYPMYACSNFYYGSGWGWTAAYGPCGLQDVFLRQYPYYYDTRRYVGDRRVILRQYEHLAAAHRFKESPVAPAWGVPARGAMLDSRTGLVPASGGGGATAVGVGGSGARPATTSDPRGQIGAPTSGSSGADRTRPTPGGQSAPAASGRSPAPEPASAAPTTNRAGGNAATGATTTNRAAGRGSAAPAPAPSTGRARP